MFCILFFERLCLSLYLHYLPISPSILACTPLDWSRIVSKSYDDENLKDVEFYIEDIEQDEDAAPQVLKAHSYILSSASPIFCAMLYGPLAPDTPTHKVTIKDTTTQAFTALLQYIYQGQHLHTNTPAVLLEICNLALRYQVGISRVESIIVMLLYQIPGLQRLCEERLRHCDPSTGGLLDTFRALARHQHLDQAARIMKTHCRKMLVRNITYIGVSMVRELVNSLEHEEDLLCVKYVFNTI